MFLGSRRRGFAKDECRELATVDAAAVEADRPRLDLESFTGPVTIDDIFRALAPLPVLVRDTRRGLFALLHRLIPILVPWLAFVSILAWASTFLQATHLQ